MPHRILFLYTGNSARSQMAEALLPLIGGQDFQAESAGTHPVGLRPMTVRVMEELGLGMDIRDRRLKHVDEFHGRSFDYVITVCSRAKENCPVFPASHTVLHWSFDDPAAASSERRLDEFRRVRDEIAACLRAFLAEEFKLDTDARRPL
jgi:arsenate reductase